MQQLTISYREVSDAVNSHLSKHVTIASKTVNGVVYALLFQPRGAVYIVTSNFEMNVSKNIESAVARYNRLGV